MFGILFIYIAYDLAMFIRSFQLRALGEEGMIVCYGKIIFDVEITIHYNCPTLNNLF